VQGEPGRNRFARRQTVRVEGERRGAAGNADVRGRERHDSGELEGRHDEQRGGERMRHAERAARERRCTDPREHRAGDPDRECRERRPVRDAQRSEQRSRASGAAARAEPRDEQRRHGESGERDRPGGEPVVERSRNPERQQREPARRTDGGNGTRDGERSSRDHAPEQGKTHRVARAAGQERVRERAGAVPRAGVGEPDSAAEHRPPAGRAAREGDGEAAAGEDELAGVGAPHGREDRVHRTHLQVAGAGSRPRGRTGTAPSPIGHTGRRWCCCVTARSRSASAGVSRPRSSCHVQFP
jgi:hypothetical protein